MIETGLAGKVVIVTGGAAGIGRATALRFAAEGARVSVWDVQGEGGEIVDALAAARARVPGLDEPAEADAGRYARVDVTDSPQVENAVAEVVDAWGRVDVLVNNAGIVRDAQLVKWRPGGHDAGGPGDGDPGSRPGTVARVMSDEAFDSVLAVNLRGPFLCARAVVPHMIRGGGGVLLAASSVVGLYGNFGQTNYAATKAGVINMTRVWARELGRYGIRSNAVAPGFVATDIVSAMPDKVLEGMKAHTPLPRLGRPEDIAEAYVWLASDAASFVNGAVLSVDGGLVLGT